MEIVKTKIDGCYLIKRNIPMDNRGYFSRLVDVEELSNVGLNAQFVQISASKNYKKGTLRGMHMQLAPYSEDKLVSCVDGEVYDVCLDMRKESSTYLQYYAARLSEENGNALYIPKGCAHGFISLKDNSQLIYFMTESHHPESEKGYRWDDPKFGIEWPFEPEIISEKDNSRELMDDGDSV